ncbi:hypothetical protein K432DRAFT_299781 [Lepidopterella palustris CBS 459.81]|uniref:2EXR domain-containing protein n=1 Tax=Lepidopterella palustris CBS 459.81 TaxID=1314670 RepID=A0A8E2JEA6_9PEZI|nr:hypothetical protein K432DRAFT_299781 [Lepidopterella palustris CBS 459.81]
MTEATIADNQPEVSRSPLDIVLAQRLTRQDTTFAFQKLPAELRIQIYEELLVDAGSFVVLAARLQPQRPKQTKTLYTAILSTCRNIHDEASSVLYGSNSFWINTWPARWCTAELVKSIGLANAGKIRKVFTYFSAGDHIDKEAIARRYSTLGIDFAALHVWALRTSDKATWQANLKEHGSWLISIEEREMWRLGLNVPWSGLAILFDYYWLVRRGSLRRYSGILET